MLEKMNKLFLNLLNPYLFFIIYLQGNDEVPTDLDTAAQITCGALNNPHTPPVIIIIDALNQVNAICVLIIKILLLHICRRKLVWYIPVLLLYKGVAQFLYKMGEWHVKLLQFIMACPTASNGLLTCNSLSHYIVKTDFYVTYFMTTSMFICIVYRWMKTKQPPL